MKTKTKNKLNTNLGDLSHDLLTGLDEEELQDKKVTVFVSEPEKIKVKNEFVLLFVENLQSIVNNGLTMNEFKVLLSIVKYSSYRNVFKITQTTISKDTGIDRSDVSRIMKKLKEKSYILHDENNDVDYVNPYLFLKGGIKEFKASPLFKQLHFTEFDDIKNPF